MIGFELIVCETIARVSGPSYTAFAKLQPFVGQREMRITPPRCPKSAGLGLFRAPGAANKLELPKGASGITEMSGNSGDGRMSIIRRF